MQHLVRGQALAVLALLGTLGLVGLGPSAAGAEDPPPIDAGVPTPASPGARTACPVTPARR